MIGRLSLLGLAVLFVACASSSSGTTEPESSAAPTTSEPSPAETTAAVSADPAPAAAPAKPAKPSKEELDKSMAPPAGVFDVRPIVGTDPDVQLPAIFAKVKKGMTAKELDAVFPGLGAVPKIAFVTFTKQGARWVRIKREGKPKEVLDLAYDDAGGLKRIGYIFDPAVAKPELWDHLKKATEAKWGKPSGSGDQLTWPAEGTKSVAIQRTDDKTLSVDVNFE